MEREKKALFALRNRAHRLTHVLDLKKINQELNRVKKDLRGLLKESEKQEKTRGSIRINFPSWCLYRVALFQGLNERRKIQGKRTDLKHYGENSEWTGSRLSGTYIGRRKRD